MGLVHLWMLAPQVLEEGRLGFDTLTFLGGPAQQVPMGLWKGLNGWAWR
jgi:hypothetical protein